MKPYKNSLEMPEQCPPADVISEDRAPVFRFIKGEEIEECDFLNHKEANKPYPNDKLCEALAISLFVDEKAAFEKQKRFRKSLGGKKLIQGKLKKECGKYNIDRTQHMNLWLYKDIDILGIFTER